MDAPSLASETPFVTEALPPTPTQVPGVNITTPVLPAPTPPAAAHALPSSAGFDWATPPPSPEIAIDAALEFAHPSDPASAGAGFPSLAAMPTSPQVDTIHIASAHPIEPTPAFTSADTTQPAATPAAVDASAVTVDAAQATKAAKAAARTESRQIATNRRAAAKAAKSRAKDRAKAAREARKRGGGS